VSRHRRQAVWPATLRRDTSDDANDLCGAPHKFDWNFNKTITRSQYEQLATGDFIRRHVNVVLVVQSGVEKSHLMQAVGMSARAVGYRVFYTTSSGLLRRLTANLPDWSLTETLRWYANWALLVIDEFGLDQIEREACPKAAHLLYEVIVSCHHKRSTIELSRRRFAGDGDARPPRRRRGRHQDQVAVVPCGRVGTPLAEPTR
jgi:hypothetical protein